jgi:DNA-directed RNA polymerase subunit RPC12/RpoP
VIEIQCPNCERTLKVPEKYVGTEGACNYCGGRVQVQFKTQPAAAVAAAAAAAAAAPIPANGSGLLESELAEARAEIARLTEAVEAERLARENAATERDAALARVSELEAAVAQAAERERSLTTKAELDRVQTELDEARQRAESLGRDVASERDKAERAEGRLRDVRGRLAAIVEDMGGGDVPGFAEATGDGRAEASVCADFTPADAAAILVGSGSGRKKSRWAWLVGLGVILLAVAAGLGVWGFAR